MGTYLVRRLAHSVLVLFGVTALVFVLMRLSGDPVAMLLPAEATNADVEEYRRLLGLDKSVIEQYVRFIGQALQGDLGYSFRNSQPALRLVLDRAPATLTLSGAAFLVSLLLAIPLGILSATHRDSALDFGGRALALLGQAVPTFLLGIVLILVFAVRLRWLPAFGAGGLDHLILPSFTLGAYSAAITTRMLRSSLLDVLHAGYIQTARAKGLTERTIVIAHALRNAAIPTVTVLGLQVGHLVGGSIITEYVFSYPGMGRLVLDAIAHRDYAVVQAFVVLLAAVVAAINLLVDLLYAALDPRITYK